MNDHFNKRSSSSYNAAPVVYNTGIPINKRIMPTILPRNSSKINPKIRVYNESVASALPWYRYGCKKCPVGYINCELRESKILTNVK